MIGCGPRNEKEPEQRLRLFQCHEFGAIAQIARNPGLMTQTDARTPRAATGFAGIANSVQKVMRVERPPSPSDASDAALRVC